jgi:hypothetical protein
VFHQLRVGCVLPEQITILPAAVINGVEKAAGTENTRRLLVARLAGGPAGPGDVTDIT